MARCTSNTVRGQQCSRNALPGRPVCSVHINNDVYYDRAAIDDVQSTTRSRILRGLGALNRIQTTKHVDDFLASNIIGRVIHLLFEHDDNNVVDAAAWVLTNLCAMEGARGSDAVWQHLPDMAERCREFLFARTPVLGASLMMCLANIAASKTEYCIQMVEDEYHVMCTEYLKNMRLNVSQRRNACFLLRNLATVMGSQDAEFVLGEISDIPAIGLNDPSLLAELLWVIQKLYSIVEVLDLPPGLLVSSLSPRSQRILTPALQTVGNIVAGENTRLINNLINAGLVPALHRLLLRSIHLNEVCWILSNLAVEPLGSEKILDTPGLVFDICSNVKKSDDVYWTLCNLATRGSTIVISSLLRCGCAQILLEGLRNPRTIVKKICLEGIYYMIEKGGYVAHLTFQSGGLMTLLPELNGADDEFKNKIIEKIQGFQPVAELLPVSAAAAPAAEITPTAAGRLAATRMATELARAGGGRAFVGDLTFTADDIVYLNRLGFVFAAGGTLGLPAV
jgi:hypothetical protein